MWGSTNQMYMNFAKRVQNNEGYKIPRNTVVRLNLGEVLLFPRENDSPLHEIMWYAEKPDGNGDDDFVARKRLNEKFWTNYFIYSPFQFFSQIILAKKKKGDKNKTTKMFKLSFLLVALIALIATVTADKPKALRRLQTAAPVAVVPVAVVTPVAAPVATSSKGSKRQLVHYNTPYES